MILSYLLKVGDGTLDKRYHFMNDWSLMTSFVHLKHRLKMLCQNAILKYNYILQCSYNTEYWFSSWFSEEKRFYITVVLLITCLSYLIPDERGLWRFVVRDKVWNPMPFTSRYRKLSWYSESNIQLLHPRLFVVWQSHSPFRALRFSFNLFIKIMYHILLPMIYFWKSNIGWEDIMITYI